MWIDLAFVFSGFMLDNVLRLLFPIDPALRFLVFVPNLGFLAFLFVALKKPMLIALSLAVLLGLGLDLMRYGVISNALAYPMAVYAVKIWSNTLNESLFERVFVGTIGLFIKELALYLILFLFLSTKLEIGTWFIKREFLTLIGHIPLLIGLGLIFKTKEGLQKNLDQQRLRRERIRWNPTARP